jgi:hypothetical protein
MGISDNDKNQFPWDSSFYTKPVVVSVKRSQPY